MHHAAPRPTLMTLVPNFLNFLYLLVEFYNTNILVRIQL